MASPSAASPPSTMASMDPLDGDWNPTAWWTTTNLGEVLPGVLTPMTWSFSGPSLEEGMRRAFHAIGGLSRAESLLPADTHRWSIAVFHGRTAVSVDFIGAVADRLPGTSGAAMAEQWFGTIPEGFTSSPKRARYPIVAARLPAAAALASPRVHALLAAARRWWSVETRLAPTASLDTAGAQLLQARQAYESCFARHIAAQMAAVQPAFEIVQKLAERAGLPELTDQLVSGYGSHAETEVVDAIWRVSRGEATAADLLAVHGCHAPVQGELASASWRQDRAALDALVARYRLLAEADGPQHVNQRRMTERVRAQEAVLAALPRRSRAGAALAFRMAARQIPLRGVGKAAAAYAIDVGRAAARRIGELLVDAGELERPEDVFLLTVEEAARGSVAGSTSDLVAERRAAREAHGRVVLPGSWRGRPAVVPVDAAADGDRSTTMRGIGVSSGVVEGPVRVLSDPDFEDIEPGEILVAPFTDPGWASVMFGSAALVVDIGGMQSHAAVVARELGIPCVVGLDGATRRLVTGDRCRVDGRAGTVEVVAANPGECSAPDHRTIGGHDLAPHAD